jgi:hypothetical protein
VIFLLSVSTICFYWSDLFLIADLLSTVIVLICVENFGHAEINLKAKLNQTARKHGKKISFSFSTFFRIWLNVETLFCFNSRVKVGNNLWRKT